jgi:glutamate racemase
VAFASNDAPIGILDSGFGGPTAARAVLDRLPNEPIRCLGDTARQPHGPRPSAEVRRDARERYAVPVIEVIKPATRRAAPDHRFLTTGDPARFRDVGRRFLGPELAHVDALGALT